MNITDFKPRAIDQVTARIYPMTATFDDPAPFVVYSALKQQFGAPNGEAGKHGQWCYEFELADAMVRIQDWKLYGWTLEIYPDDKQKATAQNIQEAVLALFTSEARRRDQDIKSMARTSTLSMQQNPFRIYFDSASNLLDLAEQNASSQQRDTLCRSAFFLFLSSFEGLLNLMYDLYLKPSIRANRDGRDSVIRANLDQKILLAPVYCMCFTQETMDFPGDLYLRYKALRSLRNNFIHANMTEAMRTSVIKQDGAIFLLEPNRSKEYGLPLVVSGLDTTHLRFTKTVISEMKDAIVNAMSAHLRHDFAQALEGEEIIIERGQDEMNHIRRQF
jgi:hypothetical protein